MKLKVSLNNNLATDEGRTAIRFLSCYPFFQFVKNNEKGITMYYNPVETSKIDVAKYGFPQYAENYLNYLRVELNLAPGSIVNYANTIQTFLRWFRSLQLRSQEVPFEEIPIGDIDLEELSGLTRNDIYNFLSFCANDRENSSRSRANKLSAVRSFFTYLKEYDESHAIKSNPAVEIALPKKEKPLPKFLTETEARKLVSVAKSEGNDRDYCILIWFLCCGMRLTELVSLNIKDVRYNGDNASILIRGKGRKERLVPLNEPCMSALEYYLIARKTIKDSDNQQALFLSNQGNRISRRQVERIVEKYLAKAGLQGMGFSPHKLRHSFASFAFKEGADILDISSQLGHSNLAVTSLYVHNMCGQNRQVNDKIGVLLAQSNQLS